VRVRARARARARVRLSAAGRVRVGVGVRVRVLAGRTVARARHVAHDPIVAALLALAALAALAAGAAARELGHALCRVAAHKQLATQLAQRRAPAQQHLAAGGHHVVGHHVTAAAATAAAFGREGLERLCRLGTRRGAPAIVGSGGCNRL
jgi:hypothetical protein